MTAKHHLASLFSGLLFAMGLGLSGMMNPMKVQNFLDVSGNFDPSLILVMGGALLVSILGYRLQKGKTTPWFNSTFYIPSRNDLDLSLVTGPILFGIGWGMAGFCPGPAFANLALMGWRLFYFVIPMFSGWILVTFFTGTSSKEATATAN